MKKIIVGLSLGLSSFISQADPTDCRQLEEDGEVDCIKATSWFGNSSAWFPTFDEAVQRYERLWCDSNVGLYSICYTQYENYPPEPPEGREISGGHGVGYTQINYNTNSNSAGWFVATQYITDPKKGDVKKYSKHQIIILHIRNCPENTTAINAGLDTYLRYCKPNPIPQNNPTSCDTSCNTSSGNVSIGN